MLRLTAALGSLLPVRERMNEEVRSVYSLVKGASILYCSKYLY